MQYNESMNKPDGSGLLIKKKTVWNLLKQKLNKVGIEQDAFE